MIATNFPDYEPSHNGFGAGRSLLTAEFDLRYLGKSWKAIRPPRQEHVLFHSMQLSMSDPQILERATRSWSAFKYTLQLFTAYLYERVRFGRGMRTANGQPFELGTKCISTTQRLGSVVPHTVKPIARYNVFRSTLNIWTRFVPLPMKT